MHKICSSSISGSAARPLVPCAPRQQRPQQQRRCTVADSKDGKQPKSVDDVLREANAMLESLTTGVPQPAGIQASIDELEEMGYVCDESGCVLVLPGDRERAAGPPVINRLLTGHNWSLGMMNEAGSDSEEEEVSPYTALVSGPCWTVPLKPSELSDFVGMLSQLRLMVANLAAQGQWHPATADRPASRVKWETNHIVMKAAYAPSEPGFSIEITFRTDRRSVSTEWPADVAAAVIAAVDAETGGVGSRTPARNATATVSA